MGFPRGRGRGGGGRGRGRGGFEVVKSDESDRLGGFNKSERGSGGFNKSNRSGPTKRQISDDDSSPEESSPTKQPKVQKQAVPFKPIRTAKKSSNDEETSSDDDDEENMDSNDDNENSDVEPMKTEKPKEKQKLPVISQQKQKSSVFVEPAEDIRIEEEEREKAADTRMLFVKNMPENITEEDLKKLSSDILVVRRKKPKCRFGYFVFANEKLAEKNYTKLQNVKCGEKVLIVDFYGLKSKNPTKPFLRKKRPIHPMKLYIQNMPSVGGLEDLIRFYPDAISWTVPTNFVNKKYALVTFSSTQSARAAFDKSKSLVVGGVPVTVVFSKNIVDEADIGKKGAKKRKNQAKLAKSHKGPKSPTVQKTEANVSEDQKKELKSPNKEIETNGTKQRMPGKKSIAKGIKVNEESD